MTAGHVFIGASLDGYIAREDGAIDWLYENSGDNEDNGFFDFIGRMDGMLMGRHTYETVLGFDEWVYTIPVVVLSSQLTANDVPEKYADKVEVRGHSLESLWSEFDDRGWENVYVDGGQMIQSCLRLGLIREMTVARLPVLIGGGIPLFGKLDSDIQWEHLGTEEFPSGVVQSRYRVKEPKS